MSYSWTPDSEAIPGLPWNITFLSQRDAEIQIPINYVSSVGVSVTAACFAHNRFEEQAAVKCISNLLATGFRWLIFDLYWDSTQEIWSFCPIQIPLNGSKPPPPSSSSSSTSSSAATSTTSQPQTSESSTASSSTVSTSSSSTLPSTQTQAQENEFDNKKANLHRPTTSSSSTIPITETITVGFDVAGTSTFPVLPTGAPGSGEGIIYSIGPYQCSSEINIDMLGQILRNYFQETSTTVKAFVRYAIFNIHAAKDAGNPDGPAQTPPDAQDITLLGSVLRANLSESWLIPTALDDQRTDLNTSWFMQSNYTQPEPAYYTLDIGRNDIYSTPDGWPSDSYMEFNDHSAQRVLLGYGTVDPQMKEYINGDDFRRIFPPSVLLNLSDVTLAPSGKVSKGCLYQANKDSIAAANSSWAVFSEFPSDTLDIGSMNASYTSLPAVSNVTACGISPILNQTLNNVTADINIEPYQQFVYSSIWSWAPEEPRSSTNKQFRCAVADPYLLGRWRAERCRENHFGACRANGLPYNWTISKSREPYNDVAGTCPKGYQFAVPRTALENRYLLEAFHESSRDLDSPLWINFNSLDVEHCWVVGINSTCPYHKEDPRDEIAIPTIAAVIVLILAGLTILVKCSANRRNSRKTRKGDNGWDYEGVPS